MPFLKRCAERAAEVERIARHVDLFPDRVDIPRGPAHRALARGRGPRPRRRPPGNLRPAEIRHDELTQRRERRRVEMERQCSLTLQDVQRIASVLVLPVRTRPARDPQPAPRSRDRGDRDARSDGTSAPGRAVADVHERDLGYDITSLDTNSGELRLIEVKGLAGNEGVIRSLPTRSGRQKTAATATGYTS